MDDVVAMVLSEINTQPVDPIDKTKLTKRFDWATAMLAALPGVPCETPEQEAWWASKLALTQAELRTHEEDRTAVTKPINDDLRRINGEFKPGAVKLEELKELIKEKIASCQEARLRAQEALRQTALLAAQAGDSAGCGAALAAIPDDVKVSGASTSFKWVVASTNMAEMTDFWKRPDLDALNAHCKNFKNETTIAPIPGVEFHRVADVRATKGKTK
jgi:hypothetical protein